MKKLQTSSRSPDNYTASRTGGEPLRILKYCEYEQPSYIELTRTELLQLVRVTECGTKTNIKFAACDLQPVHMRDLRKIDTAFTDPDEIFIAIRIQVVVLHVHPIRALLLRNMVLFLLPVGDDKLDSIVISKFQDCFREKENKTPFEFIALEALLDVLAHYHAQSVIEISDDVMRELESLQPNTVYLSEELEILRLMKNEIKIYTAHVETIRDEFIKILNNEEDLRLLYLTKLYKSPSLLCDLMSFDSEEVEVILEAFVSNITASQTKSILLQHRILSAESLLEFKLDYARNYLLTLQLIFSLATIGLNVATLITSALGMNINSGLPQTRLMFWLISAFAFGLTVSMIAFGICYFRHHGLILSFSELRH